jgi:hypothetical protein
MPSHIILGNPHKIIFYLMKILVKTPNLLSILSKMHMQLPHYYDMAMTPTPTTWKNA